jgi:allantoate deiminase
MSTATALGYQAKHRCDQLGAPPYSEAEDQLVRRYLTPAHRASLDALGEWMAAAGMSVRLDAVGNLIGRYEGRNAGAPALMIGSHIDTVRNAGRYDGALGVMLGIDCVEALHVAGLRLGFAIEVIAFGDEEGSRFPASMVCSRAVTGVIAPWVLDMTDAAGLSLAEALTEFALEPGGLAEAARAPGEVLAFVEPHIEQGPVLEAAELPIGVVTAIAAQTRLRVAITGTAGHAGTTPMGLRRDPGPAAAEAILAVEQICGEGADGLVGTAGQITALPGAVNVIPGQVVFSLDIRAETDETRDEAVARITAAFEAIVERRGLTLEIAVQQTLPASPCDVTLTNLLAASVRQIGVPPRRLTSGAGHDAMVMAALCPTAMLFIRCAGGVSHNPAESVKSEDVAIAARAILAFIANLEARQAA